jgi:protein kinase A
MLTKVAETYTLCGTPEYLAPEVIRNTGHGMAVDWWALGILIYEFLVGSPPFWDENPMKIYSRIVDGRIPFAEAEISESAQSIIQGLCTVNPSERLGNIAGEAKSVKDHEWFHDINFDDLYYRRIKGPIIPKVRHAADSSNYDTYDAAPEKKSIYSKEMQQQYEDAFRDF